MGSLSAGYANEAYERRRFVLVERLRYEMEKIDLVLYRMLPPTVVAQMKQGFQVADEFDDVFILASDIVGFTKLSAASEPSEVMLLLSHLFSKFDELSEAMGVYKAITIGDAYIAVTGIFNARTRDDDEDEFLAMTAERRGQRHAQNARAIVAFAMKMIETIETVQTRYEQPAGLAPLNMRIGIHVGPLTAGVIGTKRLRYDIWGTALNTAVQLESEGIAGAVCVSPDVLHHLGGAYEHRQHKTVRLKATNKDGSDQIDSYQLCRSVACIEPHWPQ